MNKTHQQMQHTNDFFFFVLKRAVNMLLHGHVSLHSASLYCHQQQQHSENLSIMKVQHVTA